jgi:hypothetical protein
MSSIKITAIAAAVLLLCELFHLARANLVHRDPDHGQPLLFILFLQFDETRQFHATRSAPCGPKVQDHNLAFEVRRTDGLAVHILELPGWCRREFAERTRLSWVRFVLAKEHGGNENRPDCGNSHDGLLT